MMQNASQINYFENVLTNEESFILFVHHLKPNREDKRDIKIIKNYLKRIQMSKHNCNNMVKLNNLFSSIELYFNVLKNK